MIELENTFNDRLLLAQAKTFLMIMLALWFITSAVFCYYLFVSKSLSYLEKINLLLTIQVFFIALLVLGHIFMLGGIFWWKKVRIKK